MVLSFFFIFPFSIRGKKVLKQDRYKNNIQISPLKPFLLAKMETNSGESHFCLHVRTRIERKGSNGVKFILDIQPALLPTAQRKVLRILRDKFSTFPLYIMKQFKAENRDGAKISFTSLFVKKKNRITQIVSH